MSLSLLPRRFTALMLCTLFVHFLFEIQAFPVVYPSLTRTTGFAYINDTGELVTIPAALEHLLCSTPEESVEFGPASKSCSEVVFFTSNAFLTFDFLNVSSNGVIQPITRTPQVTPSNNGVQVSWRTPTRDAVENEVNTRGVSSLVREPTTSQTISTDNVPSPSNDTRPASSISPTPPRDASPSPGPLLSSPLLGNETLEVASNETEADDPPTRSVPVGNSTSNATTVLEESATEEAPVSPSPARSTVSTSGTITHEAEAEATTAPSSAVSPSSQESSAQAPTEASIAAPSVIPASATTLFDPEISPITISVESPESSQSEVALIPTSVESVIIPESFSFASIPAPSVSSSSRSQESAPAPDTESGSSEIGTSRVEFASGSVPGTSDNDTIVPFWESFSGLAPATDRTIDSELFALGSKPSTDDFEEMAHFIADASTPSDDAFSQRSINDTDPDLIDDVQDGNTPARQSRRESRRRKGAASSNATILERDPALFISSTADASLESETEVEDAEEGEERSLRRLLQDLPTAGDSTTDQTTDAAVLEANETSGFLDPTGALRNNINFVLQLEARNLPEQTLVTLEFTIADGISRSLTIYFDPSPVSADIKELPNPNEDPSRRREDYAYRVSFSSRMVSLPSEESMSCPSVTGPLNALSSAQFDATQNSLSPNDLTALIRASEGLSSCNGRLEDLDPASIVSVDSVDAVVDVQEEQINIDELRRGTRPAGSVVTVRFSTERDHKKRFTFSVGSDTGVSLSGVPVNQEERQYRVGLHSDKIKDAEDVGEVIGTTATAFMGTAIGISLVATIGTPFLSFFNKDIVDSVGSSSPLSSAVDLLQLGQRTYLMTKLAVPNLPENFIAYGQQLHWTMLDFDLPWKEDSEDDDDTEHIQFSSRKLLNNNTQEEEDEDTEDKRSENGSGKDGEDESLYRSLRRAYFWTTVSFLGMIILHLLLLAIFLANEREVPGVLRLPRLEIYLFQATIAVLAGGPANLFAGTTTQVVVGIVVFFICIVPLSFWQIHILQKYVLTEGRAERNIAYVLKPVDFAIPVDSNPDRQLPNLESLRHIPKEKIDGEGDTSWFEKYIWDVLFGPLYRSGNWQERDKKAKRVVDRFGPIFEDSRGVPVDKREVVQEEEGPSRRTKKIKQFNPVEDEYRYSIDVPRSSFCLRISDKLINLGKSVFVAGLIMGEDHAERGYQAFLILIVLCVYVAYLRRYRPHSIRWKLALAMVSATLEIVLYVLVVVTLYKRESEETVFRIDVGKAMLSVTNLSKALLLLDVVMSCFGMFKEALEVISGKEKEETSQEETSSSDEEPFEEQFWINPREAVNSKIVGPLVESVRSARSGRSSKHEPSTEQNPPTES